MTFLHLNTKYIVYLGERLTRGFNPLSNISSLCVWKYEEMENAYTRMQIFEVSLCSSYTINANSLHWHWVEINLWQFFMHTNWARHKMTWLVHEMDLILKSTRNKIYCWGVIKTWIRLQFSYEFISVLNKS